MSIIDKANKYIGHPREVDEGYEVSMRRDAYAQGYKDAIDKIVEFLKEHVYDRYIEFHEDYIEEIRRELEE